jgi:hypothetical protein
MHGSFASLRMTKINNKYFGNFSGTQVSAQRTGANLGHTADSQDDTLSININYSAA